jgi:hypothetical protein
MSFQTRPRGCALRFRRWAQATRRRRLRGALLVQQRLEDVDLHRELADLALGLAARTPRSAPDEPSGPRARPRGTPHARRRSAPAGCPLSRANRSRDSPRSRRITTPSLRRALRRTSRSPTAHFALAYGSLRRALDILPRSVHTGLRDSRHASHHRAGASASHHSHLVAPPPRQLRSLAGATCAHMAGTAVWFARDCTVPARVRLSDWRHRTHSDTPDLLCMSA